MLKTAALFLLFATAGSVDATDAALARYLDDTSGPLDRALVANLRAQGPAGLARVLRATTPAPPAARTPRQEALVDAVAGQLHASDVGAFWYEDLDQALAAAKREHKPVLSLRMLGHLDEELSCANSRFFRSLVYVDPQVAPLLRDKFVLHWQSVRPVPVVTIDMGDGRKLTSTVTGNSAHIVLDENGAVVDAIPGLYEPRTFAAELTQALALAKVPPHKRAAEHRKRVVALDNAWRGQLTPLPPLDDVIDLAIAPALSAPNPGALLPQALDVSAFAITKAIPERAFLERYNPDRKAPDFEPLMQQYGATHFPTLLSPPALAIFTTQLARSVDTGAALAKTTGAMSSDTAQNEFLFHRKIHHWLARTARAEQALEQAALQSRIYDELFQTPARDPWLGLLPSDQYAGVVGGGVSP